MDIDVVAGSVTDVDDLAALWIAMVEHHRHLVGQEYPVRAAEQSWTVCRQEYRRWLEEATGLLFIARPSGSGEPVGYILCRLAESGATFDLGRIRGDVDSLVVADRARGSGIGSALLAACRAELQRRGCSYWSIGVLEANHDAARLYERHGFRPWVRDMLGQLEQPS